MREITFVQGIKEAIDEEMEREPNVFLIGTSVAGAGIMGDFRGLYEKYGKERIRETPISEAAILGLSTGAALMGMRPIADISLADFLFVAIDELINNMSKMTYVLGGKVKVPVTIRGMMGAGVSAAYSHSQSIEGKLISIPGIKVVVPSTPYDCKGLLKSSIRDDNPVVFLLHKAFGVRSELRSPIPEGDYTIPLGKGDIKREGKDVTVVATAAMVYQALAAAEKLNKSGISVEVIDPRTLLPLDKPMIIDSVRKTGRLVIMTEECKTGSAAAEIAAIVADEAFDYLDAPIKRVCAPDAPVPYGDLEKYYIPNEDDLIKAINEVM